MTEKRRFILKSIHFNDLLIVVYDNLKEKELHLTIYELVGLLNKVAQKEYDVQIFRKEMNELLDKLIDGDVDG